MFSLSTPSPGSLDVVRRLRQNIRGHPARVRMATLNNESRELNEHRIRIFGLCELFDVFFSSCWLGVRKPTRQIYEHVLGMTQANPASSVFVDDREQNLAPARALGMKTILYTSADELASALGELGFDLA